MAETKCSIPQLSQTSQAIFQSGVKSIHLLYTHSCAPSCFLKYWFLCSFHLLLPEAYTRGQATKTYLLSSAALHQQKAHSQAGLKGGLWATARVMLSRLPAAVFLSEFIVLAYLRSPLPPDLLWFQSLQVEENIVLTRVFSHIQGLALRKP